MKLANWDSFHLLQALKEVQQWHLSQPCIDILVVCHINFTSIEMIGLSWYKIDLSHIWLKFKKNIIEFMGYVDFLHSVSTATQSK